MSVIKKKINVARRIVMRTLTEGIGKTRFKQTVVPEHFQIKRVLVCRPNHRLGNLLLITPLLQELSATFPDAKLDLFVKGTIAPVLFRTYPNIDRIIQLPKKPAKELLRFIKGWLAVRDRHYDIVMNVVFNSSSGRICAQTADASYRFLGDIDPVIPLTFADHDHMAKFPVYSFRHFIRKLGYQPRNEPVAPVDIKLQPAELTEGRKRLNDLVKNERPTIAIYTYATGVKCYDKEWWADFYARLQTEFPSYNIAEILPVENVSQIGFRAPSFYSKQLREIAGVIANAAVFIGADSGMMHLASASGVPVIGLFKSNNMSTYAPYNERSLGVNTMNTNPDECIRLIEKILQNRTVRSVGRPH